MASVDNDTPNDPNNPNPQGTPPQNTNQPMTSGGGGAVTTTGAGNVTGQVVGTNNPSQPFQNIASYLSANAPQSATLANQVASSVSDPIQKARGDITSAGQDFTNSVNRGYTPEDTTLVGRVNTNPVDVASNPNDVAAFQRQLNDTYTGPSDFTSTPGYSNLETEIANAQGRAANTQTPEGIQALLRDVEGPVTAGVNKLDSLLLNQNPVNTRTIQDSGQGATDLPGFLTTSAAGENVAAQNALTEAQRAGSAAGSALSGREQSLAETLLRELTGAQGAYADQNTMQDSILASVAAGHPLSSQQAALLNIDPQQYSALLDMISAYESAPEGTTWRGEPLNPIRSYLTTGTVPSSPPTNATVASSGDYALANALGVLAGPRGYDSNPLSNPNPALAGTWNSGFTNPSFDLPAAHAEVGGKMKTADADWLGRSNMAAMMPWVSRDNPSSYGWTSGKSPSDIAKILLQNVGSLTGIHQKGIDALTRLANNAY